MGNTPTKEASSGSLSAPRTNRNTPAAGIGAVTPPRPPTEDKSGAKKKKEFISDNGFRKTDEKWFASPDRRLTKAMTFDDRKLLSVQSRKIKVQGTDNPAFAADGPNLKRAVTFVGKTGLERRSSMALEDVVYRKHFSKDTKNSVATLPKRKVRFQISHTDEVHPKNEAIVVVDCFSTGAFVAYKAFIGGYKVISVASADLGALVDMVPEGLDFSYAAALAFDHSNDDRGEAVDKLIHDLSNCGVPIKAVVPGAETGVELADELSSRMGLRTNGTSQSTARRNKYVMGETVRKAGVRAVRQLEVKTWNQIQEFIDDWRPDPFKVIAKPMDSAGSEDVTLCTSIEELQAAFGEILGKRNSLGLINQSVLIQEYLEGVEYVVDMVSRDGEHKLTGLWEYDRRPANGASFVCHGQRLLLVSDDPEKYGRIVEYQKKVITALGIMNGPSHGEVKWFKEEPVLVEVGARCHGGDGLWVNIAEESLGVSQVQSTVDVFLSPPVVFDSLPPIGLMRKSFAGQKWLVSYQEGILNQINPTAVAEIKAMNSYRGHQFFVKPGKQIKKTRNCFTWVGCVNLCNADSEALERDYKRIEQLQMSGLLDVEEVALREKQFVAVVDPFSTGANLSAEIYQRGFGVIAVYSGDMEKLDKMTNLIPEGVDLQFEAITGFKESISDMVKDLKSHGNVVAVVAGAETGVELADQLSSFMGLRSNGTEQSTARRNKYVMGETIRKAGLRAVRQLKSNDWEEIVKFIADWNPDPFKVILKPMDSAGGEDVTLCDNIEQVEAAFRAIIGKKNSLGLMNKFLLVQEYLEGTEYVVDMVSRDGVHKVIALWEYDKRPVNGSPFVMFGERLQIISDDPAKYTAIVEYQRKVCTALGIMNGPSHGEVKWFKGEPVLVEVGARCHGGEGSWMSISDATLKCNQVMASVASYLSQEAFDALPSEPTVRYGDGRLLCLVVRNCGKLLEISHELVDEIRQMKSFSRMELFLKPGTQIALTTNCFTLGGVVILINPDIEELTMDYTRIHDMENENLFVCE